MHRRLAYLFVLIGMCALSAARADAPAGSRPTYNIIFVGDSITYGAYDTDRTTQAPPAIAAGELQKALNANVFFTNQGYPGWTTAAWQPGTDQFKSAEADATRLQAQHPGQLVFSIMLGTNDASAQGPPGSPIEPDAYGKNMRAIVDKLMADFSDAKIVINEGPWFSPNTHNSADYEGEVVAARMRGYSPVIEAVVKDWAGSHTGHVFLGDTQAYDYFGRHFQTEMVQENGRDGIFYLHPNVQGGATLGKFWAIAIAKDLKP